MKIFNLYVTIIILISFFLLYNNFKINKENNVLNNAIKLYKNEIASNTEFEISAAKHSSNIVLNKGIRILNSELKQINSDSLFSISALFLRIPSSVCSPCYDSLYSKLFTEIPNIVRSRFFIIVDDRLLYEYKEYFADMSLKNNVFGIKEGYLVSETLDTQPFPYFLLKPEDEKLNYLFIVNKDSQIRLAQYLKIIKNKFNES
jgi:hypothetical protein